LHARLFTNAYSTNSWTAPSHGSLFTGLYPATHGTTQEYWGLSEGLLTLAEILSTEGYETVGAIGNPVIARKRGFSQGFELYHEAWRSHRGTLRDGETVSFVEDYLAKRSRDRPLFLFVNLIGAHNPYDSCGRSCGAFGAELDGSPVDAFWLDFYLGRRRPSDAELDRLGRLYDAELHEVDAQLGRILRALDVHTPLDTTFLAVVSDHGENIGDHGHVNHVFSLYETTTRIPFVVRYPVGLVPGEEDARPVQLLDLFPTILGVAGVAADAYPSQGVDLLLPGPHDEPRAMLTEYYRPVQAKQRMLPIATPEEFVRLERYERRIRALTSEGWKLIWGSDGRHELYHLAQDPDEKHDLIDDPASAAQRDRLMRQLEAMVADLGGDAEPAAEMAAPVDEETQRELRALGYTD
jgi:arylsulfatase A-like enzyme